ncbi:MULTISPECIES: response regulator [Desulfosporosinus]|uniref:Stage 0 sporulation protein A homolog n=1 Tax=Desulfosporosinus acididurans TaxID=476652 RepID=A0A0J1FTE4_9FIRM|nr:MULTISPECIES: response regulator [Desulfosporosinus]KLU66263.1 chemotaxis protein CheY [Desulfosporosinus acididurans]
MKRILIADDASFMRLMIGEILARKGLPETLEAENGLQAVELFRTYRPILTILDITMPELDGLAALEEILKIDPSAKVIICSAVASEATVSDALQRGAADFISKPFRPDELLRIVKKYLE